MYKVVAQADMQRAGASGAVWPSFTSCLVDVPCLVGKVVLRKAMKSTGDGTSPKFDSAQHQKPH